MYRSQFFSPVLLAVLASCWSSDSPKSPEPKSQPSDGPKPVIVITPGGKDGTPSPAPLPTPVPPVIPTSVSISGERFELLSLLNYNGQVTWDVTWPTAFQNPVVIFPQNPDTLTDGWRMGATTPARYPIGKSPTIKVFVVGDGSATIAAWGVQDGVPVKLATFGVIANLGPRPPPPEPKPPEPKPPDPKPTEVTSFRVFLVYEAGSTLTSNQYGIIFGVDVENSLKAACNIPNSSAWRRLDKDANPASLPTGLKEAWTAAKPAITAVPCIVFQVNEKITIEALPASIADATALISKYRGGK